METVGGSRGQTYLIYSLANTHQTLDFKSSVVLDRLPAKEQLKVIGDIIRIYTMTNFDKI